MSPHSPFLRTFLVTAGLFGCAAPLAVGATVVQTPVYETQVRPILKTHCTHCHGEEAKPGGGVDLRLRRFLDGRTKDGAPLLVPGEPAASEIVRVIREGEMPKKGKKISPDELAVLENWIRAGAKSSEVEPESLP
ncbi:MAG: c-type cytochrome, partial [Chthoniobacteraceae bacterium]|nr:c-type cytochrome [Chthoniobacteraceae bacterium]